MAFDEIAARLRSGPSNKNRSVQQDHSMKAAHSETDARHARPI